MAEHDDGGSRLIAAVNPKGPARRIWAGAFVFFCLFFLASFRLFGDSLYDYPANPPSLPQNSVIVVLAGGKHRIETAYSLFADDVGEQLWIIGAGKKATVMGLARAQATEAAQRIPWDRFEKIQVERESRNTIENAFAVKRLLDQNPETKTLVVVTSSYHMRRSLLMIGHQIPADVTLVPYTPTTAEFGAGTWWHTWTGIAVTIEESLKFQAASLLVPRLGYF